MSCMKCSDTEISVMAMEANDSGDLANNGLILNSVYIPSEIIAYILSCLDANALVFRCRLVCLRWQTIVDNVVWKLKIQNARIECFSKLSNVEKLQLQLPWYLYFAAFNKNPFDRNLLHNNCGQNGLDYWSSIRPRINIPEPMKYAGWGVEHIPSGSDLLPQDGDFESNTCCFVSSHKLCRKKQIIDLRKCGIPDIVMDNVQPTITVSEWYAGRFGCSSNYVLKVRLLDENKHILKRSDPICKFLGEEMGREWRKVSISLENYGPGVRYVVFDHEGQEVRVQDPNEDWNEDHFDFDRRCGGSKMAGGVVRISLPKSGDVNCIPEYLESFPSWMRRITVSEVDSDTESVIEEKGRFYASYGSKYDPDRVMLGGSSDSDDCAIL